ncbi:putative amidoligase enzyme-domain-containing protein [Chaetomium tenue]|uniref:Amidoligase enzyme-domain-containing protein n=1 Tax=Chaetomium tenue TaxID=1854479 RepID=A0ACB7PME7_9PEZI|nr:putative amidoligase enzyme-domain-containing protein [Chaetomium globosum]
MSSSGRNKKALPTGPLPLFGVEIEIYVKIHKDLEEKIRDRRYRDIHSMPMYWLEWDFDLQNGQGNLEKKAKQRECVGKAVREIIDVTLGANHGWTCESDASLKEWALTEPPDVRKWWGIEIISPPMSVTKHWQEEIELIFQAVGRHFDFWTNECCACHVHVSPGPTKKVKYTTPQLVRMAKGAFFWEEAFKELLPPERRNNRYALANHMVFASSELGTVELRRQAGVASAMTAIHRILFALTLHVSAFRYDFDGVKTRKTRPDAAELIRELAGCIKKLPGDTCHGSRFINFLYWCQESYAGNKCYSEKQINIREKALREGKTPPKQTPGPAPPPMNAAPAAGQRATTSTTSLPLRTTQTVRTSQPGAPARTGTMGRGGGGGGGNNSRTSNTRGPVIVSPPLPSRRSDAPRAVVTSVSGNRTIYEVRQPPERY